MIGQQISLIAARSILSKLADLFGGHLPVPVEVLAVDEDALRRVGMSRRKATAIRALAERFAGGEFTDVAVGAMSDEEAESVLTRTPGVGPWTVRGMLVLLGRPDVLPSGDLALRAAVQRLWSLDAIPTEPEVVALAEAWRPFRSLAASYVIAFGDTS